MTELRWLHHKYSGTWAYTQDGHYLIQADHIISRGMVSEIRYSARRVYARQPMQWLGYYPSIDAAKQVCELNNRSRWDEDKEVGAIG